MFHLLGFLFIIVIVILVVGLTIVGSVLRAIFGFGRRRPASSKSTHTHTYHTNHTESQHTGANSDEKVTTEQTDSRHKKIFTKDEGEYVDFEEVKE